MRFVLCGVEASVSDHPHGRFGVVPTALRIDVSDAIVTMPYENIDDLPKAQTDQYNDHQKRAFLAAFNSAYKEYHGDERRAFAVAHAAAKRAGEGPQHS